MANPDAVTLAALGILSTCVLGLIWIIKFMFTRLLPVIEAGSTATAKLTEVTKKNTLQIKAADEYLRHRNGRDNEMHTELIKAVREIPAQIITTGALSDASARTDVKNRRRKR
jgi:hypothetical protein